MNYFRDSELNSANAKDVILTTEQQLRQSE